MHSLAKWGPSPGSVLQSPQQPPSDSSPPRGRSTMATSCEYNDSQTLTRRTCAPTVDRTEHYAAARVSSRWCGSDTERTSSRHHCNRADIPRTGIAQTAPRSYSFPEGCAQTRTPNVRSRPKGAFDSNEEILGRASQGKGKGQVGRSIAVRRPV